MKKNNLKRFLASLLAVLMLASATGMSPAVFAAGEDILPQTEGGEVVQPELKKSETPIEVRITSDMKDEDVLAVLAEKLIENKNEIDPQSLDWTYTCAVMGSYKILKTDLVPYKTDPREATVSLNGCTIKEDYTYYHAATSVGKDKTAEATYKYPALKDNADGQYTLHLNGKDVVINKVSKYTSTIVFKENATITYNMDANKMKQQIFANAIDWEKSVLPANADISDFEFEWKTLPCVTKDLADKFNANPEKLESLKNFAPIEGGKRNTWYDVLDYPMMGAGDQVIRVKFNGSDDYKASGYFVNEEFKVEKANVKVSITSAFKFMRAGEKIDITKYVTTNPADPALELYVVYVGVNTNLESTVYLQLSGEKEKFVNGINAFLNYFDLPDLNEGITVGEFKEALNKALEKVDNKLTEFLVNQALKKYGLTYQNLKDLVDALNQIKIADNLRFAIGSPAHAGQYFATAIAVNDNYNTGISLPASVTVLKNTGLKLELNPMLNSNGKRNTITVSQAEELKASNALCTLTKSGDDLDSTSVGAIHYWFTGVGKIYAKSTMPTAPGKYIVTASVRGGDFFAMPKTFVFTIVADPTPEVTPET